MLLVVAAAVLWGTAGTAQSFATPALSSYWIGALRLLGAAAFLSVWSAALAAGRPPSSAPVRRIRSWRGIALAAFGMAVCNIAFFAGVRATGVALGTALTLGSAPLWAGALQAVLGERVPRTRWWLGVGVAVGGLVVAATGEGGAHPLGVALCLLSGLAYTLYARAMSTLVDGSSPVTVTSRAFALAAAIALPLAFLLAGVPTILLRDALVLLWLGVAATGIAYVLFAVGLRHVSGATAVALGMAEPVAALGFAVGIVGERPGGVALVGFAIVLSGLILIVRAERTGAPRERHAPRESGDELDRIATLPTLGRAGGDGTAIAWDEAAIALRGGIRRRVKSEAIACVRRYPGATLDELEQAFRTADVERSTRGMLARHASGARADVGRVMPITLRRCIRSDRRRYLERYRLRPVAGSPASARTGEEGLLRHRLAA